MAIDDASDRVREMMERIADAAGVDTDVEIHIDDEGIVAEYVGDDLGLLIGRHGQTIDAIQHLAYRIATPGDGDRVPVVVDAAGYRERRAETLRQTGDQAAETAVARGRPVPLQAMSALERKVIHEHLKGRRGIETYSEGQEPSRYLVVAPVVS
jgi:spoIIIJ-associated protein